MNTTRTKKFQCKSCLKYLDAHSCLNDELPPQTGDLSICAYCGLICEFDTDLNIRPLTDEEIQTIKNKYPENWSVLNRVSLKIKSRIKNN